MKRSIQAKPGARKDFGKSIDSYFAKQPEPQRAVLLKLRGMIEAAAPEATSQIKWGMPHFAIDGKMYAAITGHKAHVNLVLWGPPDAYADPKGRLEGAGKTGRHLKVRSLEDLPTADVKKWLATCAKLVRSA